MRNRKEKKRRVTYYDPPPVNERAEAEKEAGEVAAVPAAAATGVGRKKRKTDTNNFSIRQNVGQQPRDYQTEHIESRLMSFCCAVCHCPHEVRKRLGDDNYIQASESSLFHRRCCHQVFRSIEEHDSWLPPLEKAMAKYEDELMNPSTFDKTNGTMIQAPEKEGTVTMKEIKQIYDTAKRQEAELHNEDEIECQATQLGTNEAYSNNRVQFQKMTKACSKADMAPAVVLDAFAGIGSGIVALKRVGIAISRIIHVEHDKVATHVYRSNHDHNYNKELPDDGVEHIYYERFEELYKVIKKKAKANESIDIDIVIGGPPCSDYSGANAHRRGADGEQGQYLLKFGKLIRLIQSCQPKTVFFLGENTILRNDKGLSDIRLGDLERAKAAFGIDWSLDFDARDVSPCRRNRSYLSNIPFELPDYPEVPLASHFLDGNYKLAAHYVDPTLEAKVNCFMASLSRIDDSRMRVFCNTDDPCRLRSRSITITEREKLMGFPVGYLKKPVRALYTTLMGDAIDNTLEEQPYWKNKETLKQYLHFQGNFHNLKAGCAFRFETYNEGVRLKLAPPQTTVQPSFYNEDGYAKHLIGNAFSIPAVETILQPLSRIFPKKKYKGYMYQYVWQQQDEDRKMPAKD